jgi:hypothetical protein
MKYMNFIDNFVMVEKFDEYRCSPINLMNLSYNQLYYRYICRLFIIVSY